MFFLIYLAYFIDFQLSIMYDGRRGSCKYDEWGYFQSEGVNVTVYPSLCHNNGTLYNGNWELGANIGASILQRKIDCNYCWYFQCVVTVDSNLYRCGISKLTVVPCPGAQTWPGHQDMSTSEARNYVICCFVMSTCGTFLVFRHCNGPHHCHVMCYVALIMSDKQSSYDDFYITTPPTHQPTAITYHGRVDPNLHWNSTTPTWRRFYFWKQMEALFRDWISKWNYYIPWHDVSQLIPTMNFNAPHNTQNWEPSSSLSLLKL